MSEQTTWIGPYKPLAGGWETWRLTAFDGDVELEVTRRPKSDDHLEDVFVWVAKLNGEVLEDGPAETLSDAQQAAKDVLEDYAVRLVDAARLLTLTIEEPEDR